MIRRIAIILTLFMSVPAVILADGGKCSFELVKDSAKVGWTAYKTTAKAAVNGEFSGVNVKQSGKAKSFEALLKNLSVDVDKMSVVTQNPARDASLKESFFDKLKGKISGSVKQVSENQKKFLLAVNLNGLTKNLLMSYDTTDGSSYTATGKIDLLDFSAGPAVDSLNKRCFDLHKGADGVSKTWSEVQINLKGTVTKSCK